MLRPTFGSLGGLRAFLGLLGRLIFEALGLLDGEVFFDILKERFVPATRIKLVDELLQFASAVQCIVVVFGQCLLGFGPVVDVLFAAVHGHLQLLEFELLLRCLSVTLARVFFSFCSSEINSSNLTLR